MYQERPVVSSTDFHTSKFSKFVDRYLEHHAKALGSYVKDTADFINKLENDRDTSKESILVALDVKVLYTSVRNHVGIDAVKETLNNGAKKAIATRIIVKFFTLY